MSHRLLAVHAHPDDESSKGAATYAYYRDAGAEVMIVSCTGGERGDIQNPALAHRAWADRDMGGLRRVEMARAQAFLDVQHRWLGYHDSGLPENDEPVPVDAFAVVPLEVSAEHLVRIIREFRPQVVHTYEPGGGYPHPDHIRTHEITVYAIEAAADPDRYPHTGPAWQVQKLYYDRIFSAARIRALHARLLETEPESERTTEMAEMLVRMGERADTATTHIHCAAFFDARDDALRAHASQVPPDSRWFFWPNEVLAELWPTEDYELVWSKVDTTLPETDLFAGLPAPGSRTTAPDTKASQ